MFAYFVAGLVLLLTYFIYQKMIVPSRLMNSYTNAYRSRGYKVLQLPYKLIGAPFMQILMKAQKVQKDPLYPHKTLLQDFDIVITNILDRVEVVLLNQELMKEPLKVDRVHSLYKLWGPYELFFFSSPRSIIVTEGQEWYKKKKVFSKIFNFDFIVSQIPNMCKIVDSNFDKFEQVYWEKCPGDKSSGKLKVSMFDLTTKITSDIILTGFLGMEALENGELIKGKSLAEMALKLSQYALIGFKDPLLVLLGYRFMKLRLRQCDRQFMDALQLTNGAVKDYIIRKEKELSSSEKENTTSIVTLLLQEKQKSKLSGDSIYQDYEQLADEIKTFMVAGSQTSSNLITALLLFVFEKPEVVSRLKSQIDSVIKSNQDITVDNMKKLPYLDCVINEISRLVPATGIFDRQVVKDVQIGGVRLQKRTCVTAQWISFLSNPNIFKNPSEFIPERWQTEECMKKQYLISMVFSGGPRSCIGKHLALTEIRVIVIKFMQRYSQLLELEPKKRQYILSVTYGLKESNVTMKKIVK